MPRGEACAVVGLRGSTSTGELGGGQQAGKGHIGTFQGGNGFMSGEGGVDHPYQIYSSHPWTRFRRIPAI